MRPARILAVALLALAGAAVTAPAADVLSASAQNQTIRVNEPPPAPAGWARDLSDLPHDQDYHLGQLSNGLRYLVLPNRTPPDQVALRLLIDAGSMQERPGEEGVAHFLEHLAFRGTAAYPDGEVQRVLEGLGLRMAADVNASTGPDTTTFIIDLPRNDPGSLETGLKVMRQFASGMLIEADKVDAERGVVLAEERSRAGPALEASSAFLKFQLGEHPYARPPIGLRSVIETVTPDTIRRFYDAFYRPERATLLIVGDVTPEAAAPAIARAFADWVGRGPAGRDPAPVTVRPSAPDVAVIVTPGAPDTSLMLRWFEPYQDRPHTRAQRRERLVEQLAAGAVARRMQGLNEDAGKPAVRIGSAIPARIHQVWSGQIATSSGVADVYRALDVMVKAHRQAVAFGITQDELDRQKELVIDATRREADRGRTGTSVAQIEVTSDRVSSDMPFVSLQQSYAILLEQAPTITLQEVNDALRARFQEAPNLLYRSASPPPGGEAGLRSAFQAAMKAPVEAYVPASVKPWPYTNFGPPGAVASREFIPDLGVTLVRFENGVQLTIKPLPSNKDLINIRVRVGRGRLQMPMNVIDASDMGLSVWSSGGLNRISVTDQARTLAGKRVGVAGRTLEDAYALDNFNITPREDLTTQLELTAAMLTDPAYRADDWATWMAQADASDASLKLTPAGVLERELDRLLHGGDLRWTINTKAMRDTWKPEDAIAYIRPIVEQSPIEVIMVGDLNVQDAIREVARTLGALPARAPFREGAGWRTVRFPEPGSVSLPHQGRSDQGYALIGWPTFQGAFSSIREERIGIVLGQMLRDNATRKFRSEGGATYSPMDLVDFPTFLPEFGYIAVAVEAPPGLVDDIQNEIQSIASMLAQVPQPSSEIVRITQPKVEEARRNFLSNVGYWTELLANVHDDPSGLEYIRSEMADYAGITPADVQAMARKWLRPETAWRLRIVPAE